MTHKLVIRLPDPLWDALMHRAASSGQDASRIVIAALADALDVRHHALYQVSTSGAVVNGLFQGAVTIADLRRHGDLGLGTFDGLDGEMMVLDGHCYQARADGTVREAPHDALTPFATVVAFSPEAVYTASDIASYEGLCRTLDGLRESENEVVAYRITGHPESLTARAACRHESGTDIVAATADQAMFTYEDTPGTLMGFWSPVYAEQIAIPGYHLHFLSDDRRRGGHVIDLVASSMRIEIQTITDLQVTLPHTEEFRHADLDGEVHAALDVAEHGRTAEARHRSTEDPSRG